MIISFTTGFSLSPPNVSGYSSGWYRLLLQWSGITCQAINLFVNTRDTPLGLMLALNPVKGTALCPIRVLSSSAAV